MYKKKLLVIYFILIIFLIFVVYLSNKFKDKLSLTTIQNLTWESKYKSISIEEYMNEIYKIKYIDKDIYTVEYEFYIKNFQKIKLKLYGKKFEYNYGINKIEVYKKGKLIQTIIMKDFIEKEIKDKSEYTNSYELDGLLTIFDINFDGYLDIGTIATYSNGMEYYYWFVWNNKTNSYTYVDCLNLMPQVDIKNKLICEYEGKGIGEYILNYYKLTNNNLEKIKSEKYELKQNGQDIIKTLYYK